MQITERQINNFWKKVTKTDSCWQWSASKTSNGYGRFNLNGKWFLAHRVSLMLTGNLNVAKSNVGAGGDIVLHKCDVTECVNPEHLIVSTQKENMKDARLKGRKWSGETAGENNPRATIKEHDARDIKNLLSCGRYSVSELAKKFHCSQNVVKNIKRGLTWTKV